MIHSGIFRTKFLIPPVPPQTIPRPRLIDKFNQGIQRKLVLVSAPAGYGKTTLVSQWIAQADMPAAWISLEPEDNNLGRFYYLLSMALSQMALQVELSGEQLERLRNIDTAEIVFIDLINQLALKNQDYVLVLDDFQHINVRQILKVVCNLISNLPPRLHLILISRSTPEISLHCLRVRRQVFEITTDDLRFTSAEIDTFYQTLCRVILNHQDLALLARRTEGWVSCLHLVANSFQDSTPQEIHAFIEHFASSHCYVWDYLFEEVFYQQPQYVREFMLNTSILRQLNSALCDGVMQRKDSRMILERLERAHLVVALDDQRRWYRYPTIINEFLFMLLEQKVGLSGSFEYHRRACDWFERMGSMADAVNHAYASQDTDRSIVLLNKMKDNVRVEDHFIWQINFLKLPEEVLERYPEVCYNCAVTSLLSRDLDSIERPLQIAERAWELESKYTELAKVYHIRALIARYHDHVVEAARLDEMALNYVAEDDIYFKANIQFVLGMAYFHMGRAASLTLMLVDAERVVRQCGDFYTADMVIASLARVHLFMGKLRQAEELYLRIAASTDAKLYDQVRTAHIFLGRIYLERNQLDLAETHLRLGLEKSEKFTTERYSGIGYACLAWIYLLRGQEDHRREMMSTALTVAQRVGRKLVIDYIKAVQVRLALQRGELEMADHWFAAADPLPEIDLTNYHASFFQWMTHVRCLITKARRNPAAQGSLTLDLLQQGERIIERFMPNAEAEGFVKYQIELLAMKALIGWLKRDFQTALKLIEKALGLAEPEHFVRIFVDEGQLMANLLERIRQEGRHVAFVDHLLAACKTPCNSSSNSKTRRSTPEILSPREKEILLAISQGLTTQAIVDKMFLSPHTVRTHIKNIFTKLEVHNRMQAVEVAELRNLI